VLPEVLHLLQVIVFHLPPMCCYEDGLPLVLLGFHARLHVALKLSKLVQSQRLIV